MFGDLDAAVFADCKKAVVVEQGLGARFFLGRNQVPEEDRVLQLGRKEFRRLGVLDENLAFDGGKHANIRLCGCQQGRPCAQQTG
ncbi:MAG: hypothetical protein A3H49_06475 [Nitrospirae bacterium RIFCSPLOWO2_02_FULL_62_14]|nr:MAG: hypothetical protein A3H49_06475 [Nitrospirae bacterium RIFCSPLOWO2_02_FULL_62_14]